MEPRPIELEFADGRKYTLEFDRSSVAFAEKRGFSGDNFDAQAMNSVTDLFFLAFRMHHPQLSKEQTNKILFEELGGLTDEMAQRLVDLFNKPYLALTNTEGKPKNPNLTVIM